MSYHGVPIPTSVFQDEVKRHQRMYPGHTVWDIAEHFRMGSPTGIKVIQEILSAPSMRRRGASRMAP
jgi:hypothetical protein